MRSSRNKFTDSFFCLFIFTKDEKQKDCIRLHYHIFSTLESREKEKKRKEKKRKEKKRKEKKRKEKKRKEEDGNKKERNQNLLFMRTILEKTLV